MNILVINGSPRGKASNTYRLAQAFLEGIKQAILGLAGTGSGQKADAHGESGNNVRVEELMVNRMDIRSCLGCFSCWNKTPDRKSVM